nr:MAG TPA: hypothetical protein [Bacteriophage sp.]
MLLILQSKNLLKLQELLKKNFLLKGVSKCKLMN